MRLSKYLAQPLPAASATARVGDTPLGSPIARHRRWAAGICLALMAAAIPAIGLAQNGPVTYAYDELGRLVAVVDGSGNAAQYNYDAVGNLLNITNTTAATVSIFTFTPNNGPTGLTVTIYGDGFSSTPSQDTVTFYNGKSATPSQASISTLVVTVPNGATTGPIKVTVGTHSATSSENFTVN